MYKDLIIIAILIVIIGNAVAYIIKSKKRGVKCIGCPSGGKCSECNMNSFCSNNKE